MKISHDDYTTLERAMMDCIKAHNLHPFMVNTTGRAWEVFHRAWNEGRFDGNALYKKYNDAHFKTAFRKMFA